MQTLRGTSVRYQSPAERAAWRRDQCVRLLTVVGVGILVVCLGSLRRAPEASAQPPRTVSATSTGSLFGFGGRSLRDELAQAQGQLDLANVQLDHFNAIFRYSSRYKISADLAASIYDVAVAEGIEPELAFRLVRVESDFNEKATSPVGAIGLTQVMPATAQFFVPGVTRARLYDRETNLRVGLRYLRTLVRDNHGDLTLALLIYNRGEAAVGHSRERGENPSNGYERLVAGGYKGTGVTD